MTATSKTTKQRLMRLGDFSASLGVDGFVFSRMYGVNHIKLGLFTLLWSKLSDAASEFVKYCESDRWVSLRVNWRAWMGTPETPCLLTDPDYPLPGAWLRARLPSS